MNILTKANEIVFERAEEKERQYGPFEEGMEIVFLLRDTTSLIRYIQFIY